MLRKNNIDVAEKQHGMLPKNNTLSTAAVGIRGPRTAKMAGAGSRESRCAGPARYPAEAHGPASAKASAFPEQVKKRVVGQFGL